MTRAGRPVPATVLDDAHVPYPHVHGFHAGGTRALVVRRAPGAHGPASDVWSVDWRDPGRAPRDVWRAPDAHAEPVWPEASPAEERAAVVADGTLWWLDLDGGEAPRALHRAGPGRRLQGLVSVDPRGGRVVVVDTKGRRDAPGRAVDEAAPFASDVVLVDLTTGAQRLLARTWARTHPQHPHPVFTPDGAAVLFTDSSPDLRSMRVARVDL